MCSKHMGSWYCKHFVSIFLGNNIFFLLFFYFVCLLKTVEMSFMVRGFNHAFLWPYFVQPIHWISCMQLSERGAIATETNKKRIRRNELEKWLWKRIGLRPILAVFCLFGCFFLCCSHIAKMCNMWNLNIIKTPLPLQSNGKKNGCVSMRFFSPFFLHFISFVLLQRSTYCK